MRGSGPRDSPFMTQRSACSRWAAAGFIAWPRPCAGILSRGHAMAIETPLTRLLGIRHPVILAPMGAVSGGKLAAAVTRAGGLGLLGPGYLGADWIEREFAAAGNTAVGIGFITWHMARHPEQFASALAHGPKVVMFSFGDLAPFLPQARDAGAVCFAQIQDLAGAEAAARAGV